jgi:hypothetical protein
MSAISVPRKVPGHAAARAARQAAQAPDALGADTRHQRRDRPAAVLVDEGAGQRLRHRVGDEQRHDRAAADHRARHEQVALEEAQPRQAEGRQQQQGRQRDEAARADAELVDRELAEAAVEGRDAPAARPDQEAARGQPEETEAAAGQQPAALGTARRLQRAHCAEREADEPDEEPAAPLRGGLQQAVGAFGAAEHMGQRLVPAGVLDRIPGQEQVADEARDEAGPDSGPGMACGRHRISAAAS